MSWAIRRGHVLEVLRAIEPETAQCVVTSPPYWGLRDYGVELQVWGGDPECAHRWAVCPPEQARWTYRGKTRWQHATNGQGCLEDLPFREVSDVARGDRCLDCDAWRGSLGLEPTPDLYVAHIVEVFREVRRVLRKDGTLWMNIGDCYAARPSQGGSYDSISVNRAKRAPRGMVSRWGGGSRYAVGVKPKDLLLMPSEVAKALRADGWWLRAEIVWAKPNPMPESVGDRPTRSHEFVYLLTRRARYYYDGGAVRLPDRGADHRRSNLDAPERSGGLMRPHAGIRVPDGRNGSGANLRDVWSVAVEPFQGAHFATFPKALVEPCIKAGSRLGDVVLDPQPGRAVQCRGRGPMSATVKTGYVPGLVHWASCRECSWVGPVGYASKETAETQALRHNREHHPEVLRRAEGGSR
jgi:DNA modification methylase